MKKTITTVCAIALLSTLTACNTTPVNGNDSVAKNKSERASKRASNRAEKRLDQKTDRAVDKAVDKFFRKLPF